MGLYDDDTPENRDIDERLARMRGETAKRTDDWNDKVAKIKEGEEGAKKGDPEPTTKGAADKGDKKAFSPTDLGKAEEEDPGFRWSPEGGLKTTKKFWTLRRKGAAGTAGAAGVVVMFAFFVFGSHFKVPGVVGSLGDLPAEHMMRAIVEKRFDTLTTRYMVGKAAGNLDEIAKPGSALAKLYKVFDAIDLQGMLKQHNGLEYVRWGGRVLILHNGREVGQISGAPDKIDEEIGALRKANKGFDKEIKLVHTKTLPIFRYGTLTGKVRVWMRLLGIKNAFRPPKEDPAKNKLENMDNLDKSVTKQSSEIIIKEISDVADCIGGDCSGLKRESQPLNTASPSAKTGLNTGDTADVKNPAGEAVEKGAEEALEKVEEKPAEALSKSVMQRVMEHLLGEVAGKLTAETIPILGQIDLLAQIWHVAAELSDNNLLMASIVNIREYGAMTTAAIWMGFADNIKDHNMGASFISGLGERLTGYDTGDMVKAMYGRGGGVPVDKIGSTKGELNKDVWAEIVGFSGTEIDKVTLCTSIEDFKVYNTPWCITSLALGAWYNTISKALGFVGDKLAGLITWLIKFSLAYQFMRIVFGDGWEAKFITSAIERLFKVLRLVSYDPTSSSGQLGNAIAVGHDVIWNRYLETNLGARDVTNDPSAITAYVNAQKDYEDSMRALPLSERLFSFDVRDSLVNKIAIAAPATPDPGSVMASIIAPLKALPASLFAMVSGRSFAIPTPASISAVDGVAQFGGNEAEINAGVPAEVSQQEVNDIQDVSCPANADGIFNNCQSYKDVIQMAVCIDTTNPCPEYR